MNEKKQYSVSNTEEKGVKVRNGGVFIFSSISFDGTLLTLSLHFNPAQLKGT